MGPVPATVLVLAILAGVLLFRRLRDPRPDFPPLERVRTKDVAEIEDWQATREDGTILGGFTQRAMFVVARREWGELPRKLAEIEKLYRQARAAGSPFRRRGVSSRGNVR